MKLRQLTSFLTLAEEGSFTKAARRIGISQPSLSEQIRSLERELGGPVLERLRSGIRLTAAGRALLPEAQNAVRAAERAASAARLALGLESGELEVATLLSVAVGVLPPVVAAWTARHPDVTLRMLEYTHRRDLEREVRDGVADVAVGPPPGAWDGPVEALGYEELVVVLPPSDPLAASRTVELAALASRQWVLFQPGHGLTEAVEDACRAAGFEPRAAVRTTQVEAAIRLATAGVGPTIVPDNTVSRGLAAALARPDPPLLREIAAYGRTGWTPLGAAFVGALRELPWLRSAPESALLY